MSVPHTAVAQVEPDVEPDCIRYDIWWEAVSFISIHWPSLDFPVSLLGKTVDNHGYTSEWQDTMRDRVKGLSLGVV